LTLLDSLYRSFIESPVVGHRYESVMKLGGLVGRVSRVRARNVKSKDNPITWNTYKSRILLTRILSWSRLRHSFGLRVVEWKFSMGGSI